MPIDSSTDDQTPASQLVGPLMASALGPGPPVAGGSPSAIPRVSSQQLLGAASEIEIEHDGALYRLRRTALGKLILTK